jgi:ribosome recycling factor
MVETILKEARDKMHKATEIVRQELAKIRTGKATTALLDGIKVEYYGTMVPLSQVGNVSVADIHTLTVQPWEKQMLDPIQKAVLAANVGLNPIKDADIVRIPIPALNEERRRELVKLTKKSVRRERWPSGTCAGMPSNTSRNRKRRSIFPKMSGNGRKPKPRK